MTKTSKKIALAPIVLFTYNRPKHLKTVIEALKLNQQSRHSDLFIFSDGAKDKTDKNVAEVRKYLQKIDGFKSIKIFKSEINNGLAKQIINGVTHVINQYGRAIVLEDDIVVSPYFLDYMNNSLDAFAKEKKVWHISAWNYPILTGEIDEAIFWRVMHCWGWATWWDRWQYFEKNPEKCLKTFSKQDINRFNLDNSENFWQQVLDNRSGKINTWAIFWYATIFKHHGLCLSPVVSFTKNIGFDKSGTHHKDEKDLLSLQGPVNVLEKIKYPHLIKESSFAISQAKMFHKYNEIINNHNKLCYLSEEAFSRVARDLRLTKKMLEKSNSALIKANNNLKLMQNTKLWQMAEKVRSLIKMCEELQYLPMLLRVKLWRLIRNLRTDTNQKSKRIVYVGHSYHEKTKSTAFLLDYLKEHFEVKIILDETWRGKVAPDLSFIDESYLGVIFCQRIYPPKTINKIKNKNIVFFPMYDSCGTLPRSYWKQYKNIKFINFSKTLHRKLISWGFNSIYLQYFPKPDPFVAGDKNKIFFWQRVSNININTIEKLFAGHDQLKVHLHKAIDPEHRFVYPSKNQERRFSITYSKWFKNKEELLNLVKKSAIYTAPREYEGIGLSFLEAMAMGKAVVAANNPTMNEYIIHNKTGYLYKLKNPKRLNLSNLSRIQNNVYKYMNAGYNNWEKNKSKLINFIKN